MNLRIKASVMWILSEDHLLNLFLYALQVITILYISFHDQQS